MSKEAMKLALEALALRFSEGWHEGIKIDASDIMLLNDAAQALAEQPALKDECAMPEVCPEHAHAFFAKQPVQPQQEPWRPDVCPITGLPFFMWIEHHETGQMVPTYGGPYDSYTIPVREKDGSYCRERYDHDNGWWVTDEVEDVGVQIVSDQAYVSEDEPPAQKRPQNCGTSYCSCIECVMESAQQEPEFFTHNVEQPYDWSEWVCPDPQGYLMKCCDCGLVHEAEFGVVRYKSETEREDCDIVDDPNLQAVFRMRRSEQWSPVDTAHRAGGMPMEQPAQQEPLQNIPSLTTVLAYLERLVPSEVYTGMIDVIEDEFQRKEQPAPVQQEPDLAESFRTELDKLSQRNYELRMENSSLKASPQPAQRKPLTDEQIDAAVKAWFENDIVPGRQPFARRMRAAIEAARGIKGE